MARVKGGYTTNHRRKKILKAAKGYYGAKHSLYRTANEQVMNSLAYAYRDRKNCKREFRKLWIQRINATVRNYDLSYSRFIDGLNKANINLNRKILSELSINQPEEFEKLVLASKSALAK
ncbi:50S ribosomal protein L20 [Spiroplasma endosymbiont of Aleiodes alternator]|uniref:50S ribosomal protein L20 n=1 Tax=Spiroplasma endosymbiont of Aleiodes alternator TaxID=3139329 RepID=UPI003CCA9DF5